MSCGTLEISGDAAVISADCIAPVNRLVNELLVEIFELDKDSDTNPHQPPSKSWTRLTHVCSYWRAIALATPKLWNTVHVNNDIPWLRVCMQRSKDAVLDISVQNQPRLPPFALHTLFQHAHRIRRLCVDHTVILTAMPFLNTPMPMLEALSLACGRYGMYGDRDPRIAGGLAFSPTAKHFPRLRSLRLNRVFMPWNAECYINLVHLELISLNPCNTPTLDTFLDILGRCPGLEVLTVFECGPTLRRGTESTDTSSRRVSLPKLLKLTLINVPEDVSLLLSHLDIPAHASLGFGAVLPLHIQKRGGALVAPALPRDRAFLPSLARVRAVELSHKHTYSITGYTGAAARGEGLVSLWALGDDDDDELDPAGLRGGAEDVVAVFAAAPVERLDVVVRAPWAAAVWAPLFATLPRLEKLRVQYLAADVAGEQSGAPADGMGMFEALQRNDYGRVPCPRLKTLALEGCRYDQGATETILRCLQSRREGGAQLESLSVEALPGYEALLEDAMETVGPLADEVCMQTEGTD